MRLTAVKRSIILATSAGSLICQWTIAKTGDQVSDAG